MRFLKYISEEQNKVQEWVEALQHSCGQYLKESPKGSPPLYRGLNKPIAGDGIAVISVNLRHRAPRDTALDYHNMINEYFTERFGYPFRNGVFATTSEATASMYGTANFMIPADGYEILGSPTIEDMTQFISEIEYEVSRSLGDGEELLPDLIHEVLWDELDRHTWLTNLPSLLKRARGCEFMFFVDKYVAVAQDSEVGMAVLQKLGVIEW
jgi:hypothetical protein